MKNVVGWIVVGLSCALLAACQGPEELEGEAPQPTSTESVGMKISLAGDACGVTRAAATVSAPDMAPIGPVWLDVSGGYIQGQVMAVPVGARRLVSVRAYNSFQQEVYSGSAEVEVRPGQISSVYLVLYRNTQNCGSNTGDIYITGSLDTGSWPDGGTFDAGTAVDAGPGSTDAGWPSYDGGYPDAGFW